MTYVKISDLSFAQTLTGNEILPVVQNGTSYKVSVSAVGGAGGDTENINGCCNDISTGSNYSSIVGGKYNDVYGNCSFIGGGSTNALSADFGFIGGGNSHKVYSPGGIIGGGSQNLIDINGYIDTIGGGNGNSIRPSFKNSFIGGGYGNAMSNVSPDRFCASTASRFNSIGGGNQNAIGGFCFTKCAHSNTIAGGKYNGIGGIELQLFPNENCTSNYNFIGGGYSNGVNGHFSGITAGSCNRIHANLSGAFIGGGYSNTIRNVDGTEGGDYSSIVGGKQNQLSADFGFIGGGWGNTVSSACGTIGGGYGNSLSSVGGFIGSGLNNTVKSGLATDFNTGQLLPVPAIIVGGQRNKILNSTSSFIGGGDANKIAGYAACATGNIIVGGYGNQNIDGFQSVIIGGTLNTLSGNNIDRDSNSRNLIGGGCQNTIIGHGNESSQHNAILAGSNNQIGPETEPGEKMLDSVIAGGKFNQIITCGASTTSFIGAGQGNSLTGTNFAGNSLFANVSGLNNAVVAGYDVDIYGCQSFIGSGFLNTICGDYSSIITGCSNNNNHNNSHIVGSDITTVSGNMLHANTLYLSAAALPTTDPGVSGVVWRDGTDLKISL